MSLLPMLWALKSAPVVDAEERVVLVALAESAWSDGTNAFPSKKTIADIAKIDPKTAQRRLKSMTERGLIAKGNQAAAAYIPEHFRPTVYDLMIPYSWFPDIEQVNAERKAKGKAPLTPEERPDLAEAPPRKQRADKGQRRPKRGWGLQVPRGGLSVPR
ncbi:helix-turn-helix domain-containing protein [Streptomyces chiangmaiensis]